MHLKAGLCFILLFVTGYLLAQAPTKVDREWVFNKSFLVQKEISLSTKDQPVFNFPYLENIEVIDARPDTLGVGFRTRSSEKKNTLLLFNHGLKTAFEDFIRSTSKFHLGNGGYTVHMVVKEFWLKEFETDLDDKDKVLDNTDYSHVDKETLLKAAFDFYLSKNGDYFAAYRFDTSAVSFLNIKEFSSAYLSEIVHYSISRFQSIEPDSYIANKRKFTRAELVKYYADKLDKPILKDTQYRRGVYQTFSEFLNNRPSISNFVVKKDDLADVLYVSEKGQETTPIRNVWGYCDGRNLFIKSGENYFMLTKVQNSFYFLGSKELRREQSHSYVPDPYSGYSNRVASEPYLRNRLIPLKVDLDKGSVY